MLLCLPYTGIPLHGVRAHSVEVRGTTTARIRRDGAALPFTCATRSKLQPVQCTLKAQGSRAKPKGAPKCEKREGPTVRRKGLIYSRKVQGGMIHED